MMGMTTRLTVVVDKWAYKWLKEELGSRLQKMQVGLVLDW